MEINKIIKNRRQELGLTLKDVAKALGIAESTVSRYESSDIQNMGIDKIEALSKVLHCSPAYLMGWEENEGLCGMTTFADEIDEYTQELGEFLYYNQEHKVLFDSVMNVKPSDVELAKQMLDRINGTPIISFSQELKAARNNHADEPGEQEKMQSDIANLKRPK